LLDSPAERQHAGVFDSLVRLSAGIEAVEDILADLEQALARNGRIRFRKQSHRSAEDQVLCYLK
jgi:hypothetical protein